MADEDFDNRILRGLIRRQPHLDIIRIQDTSLSGKDDATILEWAFQEHCMVFREGVGISDLED